MTETTVVVDAVTIAASQGANGPTIDITAALIDAAALMVIGMGFVFLFLSLLIVVINMMAKWVPEEPQAEQSSSPRPTAQGVRPEVVAAISSAVHQYRARATS